MKKAVTRLLFGCLMFSLLLFTMLFTCGAQTPAMAASYLDIQDFCGEIYAYDCYGHRVDHEWFWQSPITIENPYFFPEIESIIFFPQVGKSYEYSRDRVHFFSLSKGMTISGIEDLIVQEVLSYNAVFVLEEDNLTISVQQGGYLAEPPEAPVREGEVFLGWKEEGQDEIFDFETTPITQNYVFVPCYQTCQCTITFTLGGEPYAAREIAYGETLADIPSAPVREGEDFLGWKEEGQDEIFDFETTPITQKYVFVPCYQTCQCTITFTLGGEPYAVREITYGETLADIPSAPVREGEDFLGWKEEGKDEIFDFETTPITQNHVFISCYELCQCTLTFTSCGTHYAVREIAYGETLADIPAGPDKDLYEFDYWIDQNTETAFDFATPIISDKVFLPFYHKIASTVTFVTEQDTFRLTVPIGECVEAPAIDQRTGYTAAWCVDGAAFDFSQEILSELTLTAVYTRIFCEVYFDIGEGSVVGESDTVYLQVAYGEAAPPPQVLPPIGYRFSGWSENLDEITSDLTVHAIYSAIICLVSFYIDGTLYYENTVSYGTVLPEPDSIGLEIELPEGHYLDGWTHQEGSEDKIDFLQPVTDSLDFYGILKRVGYQIHFYDGTKKLCAPTYQMEVLHGDTLTPPAAPAKAYAEFLYWSLTPSSDLPYNSQIPVTDELTLYAHYKGLKYTVFAEVSQGISLELSAEFADIGETISFSYTLPKGYLLDEKAVYTQTDTVEVTENAFVMPASDVTLKLKLCAQKYTVDVFTEEFFAAAVPYGEPFVPADPAPPAHYIFADWYTDDALTSPYNGTIQAEYGEAVYLYAKYEKESYRISFLHGYGGGIEETVTAVYGEVPMTPAPFQTDYLLFDGWNAPVTEAVRDTVYTANYKLLFDLSYYDGETLLLCVMGEPSLSPSCEAPAKDGFSFMGFITESIDIPSHSIIYRAVYTPLPATVTPPATVDPTQTEPPEQNNQPSNPEQNNQAGNEGQNLIVAAPETNETDTHNVTFTANKLELLLFFFVGILAVWLIKSLMNLFLKRKNSSIHFS